MKKTTATSAENNQMRKILIVEDEADMCLLLNIMLTEDGIDIEHVKTISAARDFLQEEQPSVILLDNKLPDGYGVDFVSFIKKNYPALKVIMISGFSNSAKDVALDNGADLFLEKPFTKEQLYRCVHELLLGEESVSA